MNKKVVKGQAPKAALPLFYKQVIPLSREKHTKSRIDMTAGYGFAKEATAVAITDVEFGLVAKEYPIVFVQEGESLAPVAVMGIRQNENLYVDDQGEWLGGYIPAYIRRFPFILANQVKSNEYTICIEEEFAGLNLKKGDALFDKLGQETTFLKEKINFLKQFNNQYQATLNFATLIFGLGILQPMDANVTLNTGGKYSLNGFYTVNKQKLNELDDDVLAGMVRDDQLHLIYEHLTSLTNFPKLVDKVAAAEVA
ncbi:MAG: SapC family protein [Sedimenticola sp.]